MTLRNGRLLRGCISLAVRFSSPSEMIALLTMDSHCIPDNPHFLDCCVMLLFKSETYHADKYSFPGLARNTPELRQKAEEFQAGEISRANYDYADTMKRSELSNIAFYVSSVGEVFILA